MVAWWLFAATGLRVVHAVFTVAEPLEDERQNMLCSSTPQGDSCPTYLKIGLLSELGQSCNLLLFTSHGPCHLLSNNLSIFNFCLKKGTMGLFSLRIVYFILLSLRAILTHSRPEPYAEARQHINVTSIRGICTRTGPGADFCNRCISHHMRDPMKCV